MHYPLLDFRKYWKDMLKLTDIEMAGIKDHLESFDKDYRNFLENKPTDRGESF